MALIGTPAVLAALAGCGGDRPVYAATQPSPPDAMYSNYEQHSDYGDKDQYSDYSNQSSLESVARSNGFNDGLDAGRRDRYRAHSYRPTQSERYEDAPGYYRELGGNHDQYRYYYRSAYERGYHRGYEHPDR